MSTGFTYENVLKFTLEYFGGDELAATTWISKYAVKNEQGDYLEKTPEDMHRRMAREFARIEAGYETREIQPGISEYGHTRSFLTEDRIFRLFQNFRYIIPQGSVMASLGNPGLVSSLSNCVVLPEIHDSYGGIFYTDQQMAQLFKRRCGVGVDLSSIRPAGMFVHNSSGTSAGPVSFMDRFSDTTREVSQKGRRGALMMTMDVAHPDIEKFVQIKQDLQRVTGANISVRISDEFMRAVETKSAFVLRFPVDAAPKIEKKIPAERLWDMIVQCARNSGEPGVIFWDRQHRYSTSSVYPGYRNTSTNPCSEVAMQGGDSCRLIAMNLFSFVEKPFTNEAKFNRKLFYELVYEAQRLMDDLVDLELETIQRILDKVYADPEPDFIKDVELRTWKMLYESGRKGRRTGLGFTALADTLAALGLKFDSEEALVETERIMRIKCMAEFDSSIDMAIERGAFGGFDPEIEEESEFIQMIRMEFPEVYGRMMKHGRRNISISTVAPTGTLSILSQTSSGIEPVFMLSYLRRRKIDPSDKHARVDYTDATGDSWQEYEVYHPGLKSWMQVTGKKDIAQSPYSGASAAEIDWKKRVEIQSVVQKYTTHSISSTINLPEDVSAQAVNEIFMTAWRSGLKGITVYREGARSGVLVANEKGISCVSCVDTGD